MFFQNWWQRIIHRKADEIVWKEEVPFVNFRYRDETRGIDVRLNFALIGSDMMKPGVRRDSIMRLAEGLANAVEQELSK